MYADQLIDRYRALYRISTESTEGERTNAQGPLAKMRKDYPGIHEQAFPPAPPPPPPTPIIDPANIWSRFREGAASTLGWAARVAAEVAAAEEARGFAEDTVEITIKVLNSGRWQAAIRIQEHDLEFAARNMTPTQKIEFVQRITSTLEVELLQALEDYAL
jgi:hypothetical protein